jgi:DUF1009 family protein
MRFRFRKHESKQLTDEERPIALLAGWGAYPLVVAEALKKQNRRIVGIGILDHADPKLAEYCDEFDWMGLGGIGKAKRLCKRWGARQAIMAGKVHKIMYYQPLWWIRHRPDWGCIKAFYPQLIGTADRKDDTLLGTLVDAFAAEGIAFQTVTDFAPELLVQPGHLAGKPLTHKQQKDVDFGWQVAKSMGGLDIGQCVCIKDQTVIAVEAIEGTDLCIRRAGELCAAGGFTVVKVAKPTQDMRFDVPTVGPQTLETIAMAGGKVLAVEAGKTILLEPLRVQITSQRLKISIIALHERSTAIAAA